MRSHSDDRRTVWLELFKDALPTGNLNLTWVQPGAILAWHRHQRQDDHMLVIQGTLKVGRWQEAGRLEGWTPPGPYIPGRVYVVPDGKRIGSSPEYLYKNLDWTVLSEHDPKELKIERGLWHGYQNIGVGEALVLTWITQPYDPTDEERLSPEAVNISWERVAR